MMCPRVAPPGLGCGSVVPQVRGPDLAAEDALSVLTQVAGKLGLHARPWPLTAAPSGQMARSPLTFHKEGAAAAQSVAEKTWEWLGATQPHQPSKGLEATGRKDHMGPQGVKGQGTTHCCPSPFLSAKDITSYFQGHLVKTGGRVAT